MAKAKTDLYQDITNSIIEEIEADPKQWESGLGFKSRGLPTRHTGEYYQGINALILMIAAHNNQYSSDHWITFKQARSIGANVIKGEKATRVVFFKPYQIEDKNNKDEKITIPMLKQYFVFNRDQIENLPASYLETVKTFEWSSVEAGEKLLDSSICPIHYKQVTPSYSPIKDSITLPNKELFNSSENFYATLAHEMAHSTGHKSRLDRFDIVSAVFNPQDTKKDYAFEELIAELSAIYTCSSLGINGDIENHASYLKSWLKAMKNDKKFIFKAASKATKATEMILDRVNLESTQAA